MGPTVVLKLREQATNLGGVKSPNSEDLIYTALQAWDHDHYEDNGTSSQWLLKTVLGSQRRAILNWIEWYLGSRPSGPNEPRP